MTDIYAFGPDWALPAAVQDNITDAAWDKPALLPAKTDWNSLTTPGSYGIWSEVNAPSGAVETWTLQVGRTPTAGNVTQVAFSWTTPGRVAYRRRNGTTWSPWVVASPSSGTEGASFKVMSASSWDAMTTPGAYSIWTTAGSPTPEKPQTWTAYVGPTPTSGNFTRLAVSWSNPGEVWTQRRSGAAWSAWSRVGGDNTATLSAAKTYTDEQIAAIPSPAVTADVGVHQHAMRLSHLRARVGAPRMGGKAAVTLICDHGTNNFASIVLPALKAAGLRCTLALNSQMYDSAVYNHAAHENQTTWSQIRGWATTDGIEIANHGRTHKDATGNAAIRLEIEGGREDLETNLPGVPIDTFVQIGTTGTGDKWDGFNDALTLDRYWKTYAGRVILDSHALVTGQVPHGGTPTRVYPLDGHPPQGASGYWLDGGQSGIDTAKTKIDEAVTAGRGVILRLHPYLIDWPNQISAAQLTEFFTYLKTRQDAGEINVLTYREWALSVAW